jgi:hypothetical protein
MRLIVSAFSIFRTVLQVWQNISGSRNWHQILSEASNFPGSTIKTSETFEKCSILSKCKEGENFNRRNILNISRIALKLHCVPKFEPDTAIGQKGAFFKGLAQAHDKY